MTDLAVLPSPFVCLIRHGETEFSVARRYNGVTDAPLTAAGEALALQLAERMKGVRWEAVLASDLHRARRTAELAGYPDPQIVKRLRECDYGDYEGHTTEEILAERPNWDFWRDGCPNGEDADRVAERIRPVEERLRESRGPVLVFSHSYTIRVFATVWLGLEARWGQVFSLEPCHVNVVGTHRGVGVIELWNDGVHVPDSYEGRGERREKAPS